MTKKIFGGMTIASLLFVTTSAMAAGDVTVLNTNVASVYSTAVVSANTGWNSASAGAAALGGNGGSASASHNGLALGGNGGDGIASALGGEITTGNAAAVSVIGNDVNHTDVSVDLESSDCKTVMETDEMWSDWGSLSKWGWHSGLEKEHASEWDSHSFTETPCPQGDVLVANTSIADVDNVALVSADTGHNYVGAEALASGGNGGDADVKGGLHGGFSWWWNHHGDDQDGGEAIAGNGGMGIADAMGGTIMTGDAAALSEIGSVVNDTVVHVTEEISL